MKFFKKLAMTAVLAAAIFSAAVPWLVTAALPDYVMVFEVHTLGDDTNGGGFVTGGSGTDYSLNNAATQAYTDLVAPSTTTLTSVARPFIAADIDNLINITAGTGFTTGRFRITGVTTGTATVDRAIATMGSTGGTGKLGGALATIQAGVNAMLTTNGSGLYVKNDATYLQADNVFVLNTGGQFGWGWITGYTTTRGDGGRPTLQAQAGMAGADKSIFRLFGGPTGFTINNFILDCNNQAFTGGIHFGSSNFTGARHITAENCSDPGFQMDTNSIGVDLVTINTPAAGISGRQVAFSLANVEMQCIDCRALGSTVNGAIAFFASAGTFVRPICANFTGTTADCFSSGTLEGTQFSIWNAGAYNITRDFFRLNEAQGLDTRVINIQNAAISNVGGYCFDQIGNAPIVAGAMLSDYNGCNPTGALGAYNNWPAGAHDVTLSVSPFTNGASNDFSLNSTAGGGAALKGVGFPGVYVGGGGTGHLDIGALQSSGGAAAVTIGSPF